MTTKKDIFAEHLNAWLQAKGVRAARAALRAHIVFVTKCHPGSVARSFKRLQMRSPGFEDRRGRPHYYGLDVTVALREIWELNDEPCGELLHPVIATYVHALQTRNQWTHDEVTTGKLLAMSERTVKRRVAVFEKLRGGKRGKSGTSPSALRHIIPIFKGPWTDVPPGNGQLDTVAHCGESLAGSFIWTLNYTDAATYWTILRAQWNKGQEATKANVIAVQERLPWPLLGLHPDSGGEFINHALKEWCDLEKIALSRSEPYKKNDNMFVEERNGHVVRRYTGYDRLEDPAMVPVLNELYAVLELFSNHFKAVRRMLVKVRIGAKYVRKFEKRALTPYERVLAHPIITENVKNKLRELHEQLDPLSLKHKIDMLKARLYKMKVAARNRSLSSSVS